MKRTRQIGEISSKLLPDAFDVKKYGSTTKRAGHFRNHVVKPGVEITETYFKTPGVEMTEKIPNRPPSFSFQNVVGGESPTLASGKLKTDNKKTLATNSNGKKPFERPSVKTIIYDTKNLTTYLLLAALGISLYFIVT